MITVILSLGIWALGGWKLALVFFLGSLVEAILETIRRSNT